MVNQPEFPVPRDRVVLLDIDGTLIDVNYQVTDSRIYPAIQEAQEAGWVIGLSSDTPHETMVEQAKQFGIKDGPLVSEKGGQVTSKDRIIETTPELKGSFRLSRERIVEFLASAGFVVRLGNPVDVLQQPFGSPGEPVAVVNTRREFSMSIYFRRVSEDGGFIKSPEVIESAMDEIRRLYPDYDDLEEDVNHEYGLIIVNRQIVTKRLGTQALMAEMGLSQVAMVGNSFADYLGKDIALHYAVADAKDEFKRVANFISELPLTAGAAEIISLISRV